MNLTGDKALIKAMGHLKQSAQRKVARPAVNAALTPVNKEAKRAAKRTQRTGQLWRSIGKRVKGYKQSGTVWGGVGPRSGFRIVVDGQPVNPLRYGHFVEFGTRRTVARPFLRPALDTNKARAFEILGRKSWEGLAKEAARARAKGGRR
jgi:HK97 gp10 family phage protein